MPVSATNSKIVFDALKDGVHRLISALPETWLVHLIRLADDDPDVTLVRLAKEEEGVGISMGAHLAGVKSAMLMQNHGFLASVNGIVSGAQLFRIPLVMLISDRGSFGERDPWQTEGGAVTEPVLAALRIPLMRLDNPIRVASAWRKRRPSRIVESSGRVALDARLMWETSDALEAMRAVYERLETCAVVTIMGAVAASAVDRARQNFFSLQTHGAGLVGGPRDRASRLRCLSWCRRRGSVLMNLGGLSTLGATVRPTSSVISTTVLLSVGGFPTATSTGCDLAAIAGAGVPRTACVSTVEAFVTEFADAQRAQALTTIVAKVDAVGPAAFVTELGLLENRFQFQRYLQAR